MKKNHHEMPSIETLKCILTTRLILAEKLIKSDLDNSFIRIEDTASFNSLHESTDPNCYISDYEETTSNLEKEHLSSYSTEDWIEYWETLIEIMDAWLKGGMNGNILDHLDDDILIERF
ncbi:hypothetical protein [Halomonas stenophila]|uniref:Uncharacterized protein n=1 Tax=Halomonas stenophila TaxID=795312 RepID=A0A7W5ETX6_9GAMM|nr:hypothetical protein [Halomonas stenophila]MBB3231368.1 hypothetical protein [Halomonas stenophila]